jgi:hypothetical protein
MPRCGTNFLSNLLLLHPDCASPDPVWEDFLVAHLDLLRQYSDAVSGRWDKDWGVTENTQAHLDTSLGLGIATFLQQRCNAARVISKTPCIENLGLFFEFFPAAKLLILVRDGRSVIESCMRSFGWHREPALHSIADSAAAINNFRQENSPCRDKFRILRYEDLWQDSEAQLRELLSFLHLNPDHYDFDQALNLPVRGSSDLKTRGDQSIHWDPVEKTVDFDPMSRFANWSPAMHYRYNRVAGPEMRELGYCCKEVKDPVGLYRAQGLFLDAAWRLRLLARPVINRLRRS